MKWTDKQSILLSKISIYVISILAIAAIIFMKPFMHAVVLYQVVHTINPTYFSITMYLCLVVGLGVMYFLHQLVSNISNEKTFGEMNIRILRIISWLCIVETVITLGSSFYYMPWIVIASMCAFIALMTRIIKNVFCQARMIKEENDFTI